jgi:hypothetical protein
MIALLLLFLFLAFFHQQKNKKLFFVNFGKYFIFLNSFFLHFSPMLEATLDRIIDRIEAIIFKTMDFPQNHQCSDK